jgi:hypothetical protein
MPRNVGPNAGRADVPARSAAMSRSRLAAVLLIGALVILGVVLAEAFDVFGTGTVNPPGVEAEDRAADGEPLDLLGGRAPAPAEPVGGTPAATGAAD